MNAKGQAFDIYKLLIGTIIAFAILLIILSIVDYMETFKYNVSRQRLFDSFKVSLNSPNGAVVLAENIVFKENDLLSLNVLAESSAIKPDCVDFYQDLTSNSSFELSRENKAANFKNKASATVFFQCNKTDLAETALIENCPVTCIVSIGKKIPAG